MSKKIFYISLFISLIAHICVIKALSDIKIKQLTKPIKQIEVTYHVAPKKKKKKVAQFRQVKAFKKERPPRKIEILDKNVKTVPYANHKIGDMSKITGKFRLDKKHTPKISPIRRSKKVSVTLPSTQKIKNPGYLNYYQIIGQMIKQQAYLNLENTDSTSGGVYLTFLLASSGRLKQIMIKEEKTYADTGLRETAKKSIQDIDPFPPFPSDFDYPEFTFNVLISFEGT